AATFTAAGDTSLDRRARPASGRTGARVLRARRGAGVSGGGSGGGVLRRGRDDQAGSARRRPKGIRDRNRRHERGGARAGGGGRTSARCRRGMSCGFSL